MSLTVYPVHPKDPEFASFIELPYRLHAHLPHWVPPLRSEVRKMFDAAVNPFFDHADVQPFIARRASASGTRVVGRVAAIHNRAHNHFHEDHVGFFGFFECEDDPEVAAALLGAAEGWVAARGLDTLRGPMNFSTNDDCGLLIQGFERPPMILMPHNPPYYQGLIEAAGFHTAKNLLAYHFEAHDSPYLARAAATVRKRCRATTRSMSKARFNEDVQRIRGIYNAAWERNWGFVPMTEREFDYMAKDLKPIVDTELVRFAEVDGETVGFAIALPDLNGALAHLDGRLGPWGALKFWWHARRITAVRVLTLGVREGYRASGVDVLLYCDLFDAGMRRGYRTGEFSWVLEDNMAMRRPLERLGAVADKVYRVYDRPTPVAAAGAGGAHASEHAGAHDDDPSAGPAGAEPSLAGAGGTPRPEPSAPRG